MLPNAPPVAHKKGPPPKRLIVGRGRPKTINVVDAIPVADGVMLNARNVHADVVKKHKIFKKRSFVIKPTIKRG